MFITREQLSRMRAVVLVLLLTPGTRADDWDKTTVVKFSIPVNVSGLRLSAGSYTFKVFDSPSDRTLIEIFKEGTNELLGSVRAIHAQRYEAAPRTLLVLGEAPTGRAVPLLKWFYPGDKSGYEFINRETRDLPQTPNPRTLAARTFSPGVYSSEPRRTEKWAVIVGVGEFADSRLRLKFASSDARALEKVLADPEIGRFRDDTYHIKTLTDTQATAANVRRTLDELATRVGPNDLVMLFVSSHGFVLRQSTMQARLFLAMHDMDVGHPDEAAISVDELASFSSRLRGAKMLVVLDVCMSGLRDNAKDLKLVFSLRSPILPVLGPRHVLLASCRPTESSYESSGLRSGFFTYFFMRALVSSRGLAPLTQIFEYLEHSVPVAVQKERGEQQHPIMLPPYPIPDIVIGSVQR